jgi:hypothetical protein
MAQNVEVHPRGHNMQQIEQENQMSDCVKKYLHHARYKFAADLRFEKHFASECEKFLKKTFSGTPPAVWRCASMPSSHENYCCTTMCSTALRCPCGAS